MRDQFLLGEADKLLRDRTSLPRITWSFETSQKRWWGEKSLKVSGAISLNTMKPGGLPAGSVSGPGLAVRRLVGFLRDLPAETHWEKGQGEKEGKGHVHVRILGLTTPYPRGGDEFYDLHCTD